MNKKDSFKYFLLIGLSLIRLSKTHESNNKIIGIMKNTFHKRFLKPSFMELIYSY